MMESLITDLVLTLTDAICILWDNFNYSLINLMNTSLQITRQLSFANKAPIRDFILDLINEHDIQSYSKLQLNEMKLFKLASLFIQADQCDVQVSSYDILTTVSRYFSTYKEEDKENVCDAAVKAAIEHYEYVMSEVIDYFVSGGNKDWHDKL